jgi:2-polyprenyl-6-methoxyphenol hydroxylase-like FAD-dependent oxidoreductase
MSEGDADILIVGGGPAGMMAGLLFARAGLRTLVLEKHGDFLRDFRGDTVHPSTLELFHELGLLEALLARPHDPVPTISAEIAGRRLTVADFRHLPVPCGFIAMMPQWEFLDFLADAAREYSGFRLRMSCEAVAVIEERGRIVGVATATGETIRARLVIAADGRRSILREAGALPLKDLGAPMDVFWFRVPKAPTPDNRSTGVFGGGQILALIDRHNYWQCAYVFAKGDAEAIRARGLDVFKADVAAAAPWLREGLTAIMSWDDVRLLTVALDRLTRWHRPGLLAIGDAAHAMSPIGGVGINLAVQDAVAAANILAAPMLAGEDIDPLLAKVQARRMLPTRIIQGIQRLIQRAVIGRVLASRVPPERPPSVVRLLDRVPMLQRIPARILGLGIRREHIRSPGSRA